MSGFIQVTATYSNAVLTTLLPIFSDFVKKLDLPIPTPITIQQVERFVPYPQRANIGGGYLVLTNGLELWYSHGHVEGFRTPRSYYNLQGNFNEDVRRFYGPVKLNKDEALQLARKTLLKLGYSLKETFADQDPQVELPPRIGTNTVPHYRFTWDDPVFGLRAVWIEVDANRKMVQELHLASKFFWREPPKIDVVPEPPQPQAPVTTTVSNAYLATMLPKISDYAKRLALPVSQPVRLRDLLRIEFLDFDWVVSIKLKNGYWFDCEKEHVAGFTAPDCAFTGKPVDRPVRLEQYLGKWKLSQQEAIELVRQAVRKLGFNPAQFGADKHPTVENRKPVGKYIVPRYFLHWITNDPKTGQTVHYVTAEVDANERRLKHLYLLNVVNGESVLPSQNQPANNDTNQTLSPRNVAPVTNSAQVEPPLDPEFMKWVSSNVLGWSTNLSRTNPPVPKPSPFE